MYGRRKFSLVLGILVLVVGSILTSACASAAMTTPTETPSPVDLVKAYEDAFNRQDIEGVMALLGEQVKFHFWVYDGLNRENTQTLLKEALFGLNSEVHHTDCTISQDTVTCKAVFTTDWARGAGLNEHRFNAAVFTLQENKIRQIEYVIPDVDDNAMVWNFSISFWEWMQDNYPDEYDKYYTDWLMAGGGQHLSTRIQEYAATLE